MGGKLTAFFFWSGRKPGRRVAEIVDELAEKYGFARGTVYAVLRYVGAAGNGGSPTPKKVQRAEEILSYLASLPTSSQVAKSLGMHKDTVVKWVRRYEREAGLPEGYFTVRMWNGYFVTKVPPEAVELGLRRMATWRRRAAEMGKRAYESYRLPGEYSLRELAEMLGTSWRKVRRAIKWFAASRGIDEEDLRNPRTRRFVLPPEFFDYFRKYFGGGKSECRGV
jgi:hypothetical protein